MKKIGIATFQFANNYGALLQCYALQKVINSFDDCSAEVINYMPSGYQYPKCWSNDYQKMQYKEKMLKLRSFLKNKCNLSLEGTDRLTGESYDVCCVGSDQVWNTSWEVTKEYFLPRVSDGVKKISYAASVGISADSSRFREDFFKDYISEFDAVSVREEEHVKVVSVLSGKQCECVVDPTLLLSAEDYEQIMAKREKKAPYVFFYWLQHDNELMRGVELVNAVARKYGLQVIHSIYDAPKNMFVNQGKCMMYESIEDFVWLIKNADFVVTNSYHGTIFSMIFQRPFYTYTVESMKSRIVTLSQDINLGANLVKSYIPHDRIEKHIINLALCPDFQKKKEKSLKYLEEALYKNGKYFG